MDYQRTIISGKWKLIYFPDPHTRSLVKNALFELYDIEEDPGETRNLADAHPKVVERLKKKLFEWMSMDVKEKAQRADGMQPTAIDEATRENLRALGYIQ